jgi:hypothetical protein
LIEKLAGTLRETAVTVTGIYGHFYRKIKVASWLVYEGASNAKAATALSVRATTAHLITHRPVHPLQ